MHRLLPHLLALLAGAALTAALAPSDLWPLAWLSPAAFFLLLQRRNNTPNRHHNGRRSAWLGYSYGLGFFGAGVSWVFVSISEHSATPLPIALLLTGLFVAGLALLFAVQAGIYGSYLSRSRYSWLAFAGLWWLFEWLRSWLFTGFPWLYLGYASLDTPLQHWAPVGGVWLLSLWTILGATSLVVMLQRTATTQRLLAAVLLGGPWLASPLLPVHWTQPERSLHVALVQPDIPQAIKWQRQHLPAILARYQILTEQVQSAELIIWPETAIPTLYRNALPYLGDLFQQLDEQGVSLIAGMPAAVPDRANPQQYRFHNSLAVLSGGAGVYHKQRLVPFGEYLPLENVLRGMVDFFNLPASSFRLPEGQQSNLSINGTRLAPAICYEIAYPELVRQASRSAEVLLTVSNDTWFGHSIAPDQHMQIARMRALENGRWLLRGTNNGISALVDPQGQITAIAPRYDAAVLEGQVQAMQGETPWQQLGLWPTLAIACGLILSSLRRRHISVRNAPFASA